jgi:hypothetical protein
MKLVAADRPKKRKVGLQHEPQSVASLVNLALNGMLGETQKVKIREFGEKNVVVKLIEIAPENT